MNYEDLSFDDFLTYPQDKQEAILKDYEALKAMLKKNVSLHRYNHSLSVADTCRKLAKAHGYNQEKAYLAGLLHDVCKFKGEEGIKLLEAYLLKYDRDKLNGIKGAYHSWVAPYYLKEKLGFDDEEILNAIYNHTICNSDDTLSLILYIADKREPLRNIDDDILDIAYKDLHKAYDLLNIKVKEYIESKNERFIENRL